MFLFERAAPILSANKKGHYQRVQRREVHRQGVISWADNIAPQWHSKGLDIYIMVRAALALYINTHIKYDLFHDFKNILIIVNFAVKQRAHSITIYNNNTRAERTRINFSFSVNLAGPRASKYCRSALLHVCAAAFFVHACICAHSPALFMCLFIYVRALNIAHNNIFHYLLRVRQAILALKSCRHEKETPDMHSMHTKIWSLCAVQCR